MPALAHRFGDFEHWILRGMDWPAEASRVVDVAGGEKLPSAGTPSAVAITGSHAMVSERLPWSEYTARWLAGAASRGVPILGICYGHQLLAHALGGIVDNNPSGREFGTVTIRMTDQAEGDPLLGIFRPAAPVHVCHTQAVLKLPPGAKLLASSQRDPHQAFVVGNCAWGVQFHPEFSTEVVAEYIRAHEAALRSEGQDPAWLLQTLSPNALGAGLLQRFAQIVRQRAG